MINHSSGFLKKHSLGLVSSHYASVYYKYEFVMHLQLHTYIPHTSFLVKFLQIPTRLLFSVTQIQLCLHMYYRS